MGLLFLIRRYVTCEIDTSLLNKRIRGVHAEYTG